MQLDMMLFFERIRTPLTDAASEAMTIFGEIAIPMVTIMVLTWCISRKKAFALSFSLLSALMITQTLKAIFRMPRPFQAHPELIAGRRLHTATGYSFPSGHSTISGSFYSSLIVIIWKKWAAILLALPIILVPISRMMLGVHWPQDVLAGTIIGLAAGFILTPLMLRLYERRRAFLITSFFTGIAATAAAAAVAMLLAAGKIDRTAFDDLMINAAIAGGLLLGFYLERRTVGSAPEYGSFGMKAVRFLLGLISSALLALLIAIIPAPEDFTSFTLFFALGIWCSYLYPLIAVRTHLMETE